MTSEKPNTISGNDKNHSKGDFIDGSFVNAFKQPVFYTFASEKSPGHETFTRHRIKLYKTINQPNSNRKIVYVENDKNNNIISMMKP